MSTVLPFGSRIEVRCHAKVVCRRRGGRPDARGGARAERVVAAAPVVERPGVARRVERGARVRLVDARARRSRRAAGPGPPGRRAGRRRTCRSRRSAARRAACSARRGRSAAPSRARARRARPGSSRRARGSAACPGAPVAPRSARASRRLPWRARRSAGSSSPPNDVASSPVEAPGGPSGIACTRGVTTQSSETRSASASGRRARLFMPAWGAEPCRGRCPRRSWRWRHAALRSRVGAMQRPVTRFVRRCVPRVVRRDVAWCLPSPRGSRYRWPS